VSDPSKPIAVLVDESGYTIVDLPLRLTAADFAKLSAAAANLSTGAHTSPLQSPGARMESAVERAVALLDLRKKRDLNLGTDLFGEPAWDIMLDLFIRRAAGRRTNATSAAIASRAPTTTALRYIALLEKRGLLDKNVAEHDLRVQYVELSDEAYEKMTDLLSA
jgi:hypothetical protein